MTKVLHVSQSFLEVFFKSKILLLNEEKLDLFFIEAA